MILYAGALIEHNLLALAAYRMGKELQWDAEALRAANCPEADKHIKKEYRMGGMGGVIGGVHRWGQVVT